MDEQQTRIIAHVDMDAFFAAVEQRDDATLRGKPVLVGGNPTGRGVVSTASYEARPFGCRSAMPMAQAIRLCPHAVIIRPDMERYVGVSREVFDTLHEFTPLVQGLSIDEAFLDLSDSARLFGTAEEMAVRIRDAVRSRTSLTCSVGVAPNMFIAKLASEANKPNGHKIVHAEAVGDFLDPLPIGRMWGVGSVGQQRMQQAGIRTFRDLRQADPTFLRLHFGDRAQQLQALAKGIDQRSVQVSRQSKSISHETTFHTDINDPEVLRGVILDLAEQAAARVRAARLLATTAGIKVRTPDFKTFNRQVTLPSATNATRPIQEFALHLFDEWRHNNQSPLRLAGVVLTGLKKDAQKQLELFQEEDSGELDATLDAIRQRFGKRAIQHGTSGQPRTRREPERRNDNDHHNSK